LHWTPTCDEPKERWMDRLDGIYNIEQIISWCTR